MMDRGPIKDLRPWELANLVRRAMEYGRNTELPINPIRARKFSDKYLEEMKEKKSAKDK